MVFRVLSLWFNNQRKTDINRIVAEEVIDVVPSYKFVPLSYQIISRVSSIIDGDTFQAALRKLVMKLSEQHPHHTLVQLIALKNSGAVEGKGALQFRTNVGDAKSEGAKVYLDELQRTEQRELLASLDIMADAYVQLALLDTRQYHTQKKKIPLSKVQIIAPNSTKTGTGMALFTPETVPFRLTRDMVDGMGVSGVDGVFTRSCEVTLQLLRKKSASVVTILEVFVHDPLYRWTLSPLKALRIQEGEQDIVRSATLSRTSSRSTNSSVVNDTGSSSNETQPAYGNKAEPSSNDAAARALIRVKQKLEGYEDPNGNALSIEGQVKHLMSAAQDPHNLCVLFPGWAPWL
ncbi:hypothetical protein BBJ29_004418 [Phytophthora kernoviae]|uniref:Uncharacterized protein n=1 Tax=Phytophthora kernoviae TaxID=325452 RepID=A0A3F2RQX2_9STRA|nr:hypothetical protein BBP00_00004678 [Phytophthora kernoviae]RLN63676.1 hypothetical protein BBJ29_004418 [Phytophthora kernoviae]